MSTNNAHQPIATIPPLTETSTRKEQDALLATLALSERAQAMSERDKMLAGEIFDAMHDDLMKQRLKARDLLHAFNTHPPARYEPGMSGFDFFGPDSRRALLADLFQVSLERMRTIMIEPPFRVDYGNNINFKGWFYANFNLTILDDAQVTFGNNTLIAPNVSIYCVGHPVIVSERRKGISRAYAVTIGDDCWIGGDVTILGPCTIGNGVTIAAGAVVRGTFPDNCVIGGVPARILKYVKEDEV